MSRICEILNSSNLHILSWKATSYYRKPSSHLTVSLRMEEKWKGYRRINFLYIKVMVRNFVRTSRSDYTIPPSMKYTDTIIRTSFPIWWWNCLFENIFSHLITIMVRRRRPKIQSKNDEIRWIKNELLNMDKLKNCANWMPNTSLARYSMKVAIAQKINWQDRKSVRTVISYSNLTLGPLVSPLLPQLTLSSSYQQILLFPSISPLLFEELNKIWIKVTGSSSPVLVEGANL